ncbi:MAG: MarR family transcriptional regulator [Eubacteriales bacterium]|nr:MarR family transcriptional regulator [Eubacteriales bacterium]
MNHTTPETQEARYAARLIGKLSNTLRRRLQTFEVGEAVSGAQSRALHFILAHEGETLFQKDIEQEFSLRPPSATQLLQKLEQNGMIRRESLPGDARYKQIRATDHALQSQEQVMRDLTQLETDLVAGIPANDLEIFLRVSRQMLHNLETQP